MVNLAPFGGRPLGAAIEALFWRETSQSPGTLIVDWPTTDQPTDQPTNRLTTEELKYSCNTARRRCCPTNNLLEVWQNSAPFGGRPIGAAVEALFWRETSQSPGTLIVDRPTTDQPTNGPTDWPQRNLNTAAIGHGGVVAPLTICCKCGKTRPPLVADRLVPPLRRCFGGKPPKAREPLLWTNQWPADQPTNQLTAEELKYSRNRTQRHRRLTYNLLEVWQNSAPFGGRPIAATVAALFWTGTSQSPRTLIVDRPMPYRPTNPPTDIRGIKIQSQ